MKNTGNAIMDALGHLEQAGIDEAKRTAMVKSSIELQQPVLEAIENLASRMDKRIDKLESKLESRLLRIEIVVFGILLPVLYIGYRIGSVSG